MSGLIRSTVCKGYQQTQKRKRVMKAYVMIENWLFCHLLVIESCSVFRLVTVLMTPPLSRKPRLELLWVLVQLWLRQLLISFQPINTQYSNTCVERPLSKRPKLGFQDQLSLNAGQKYCRMLQMEHSAILLTFIKLPFVIKALILSIFEWPFYTGFTVYFL